MSTILNPYISFQNQAGEAIEFYQTVFGGEVTLNTYKDGGMPHDPADDDKIMHAMLVAENGITLMVSDVPPGVPYTPGNNVSISLSGDDEDKLREYWNILSEGATIGAPLEKAPWGDVFGMLTDKFGITWMVNITGA